MAYSAKRIVVADLDGTLAPSKSRMDEEMASLIIELLSHKDFAVISGGRFEQFQKQFIGSLGHRPDRFSRLYLLPTCATSFYRFDGSEWRSVYAENLHPEHKEKIVRSFGTALELGGYVRPETVYGEILEDRGTQITFSALGQQAPLALKERWDPDQKKRLRIKGHLERLIPEFEVRVGGTTSIDVTKKGIDKAYGIRRISEYFGYTTGEMLFIGDALFEGGNDYPVRAAGVDSIQVSGPGEAKLVLQEIIGPHRN